MPVEELEKVDKSTGTTQMVHYEGDSPYVALCGAPVQGVLVDDSVPIDCVVCEDIVNGMFS